MQNPTPSRRRAARPQKAQWWRPFLWAGLLALTVTVGWQAIGSGPLLAADAIALSGPWRFVDESKPGSPLISGDLAAAAADAPAAVAARFNISSTMQALALQLADSDLGGLPLAQVKELSYCTQLIDSPRPYAVTLQINVDADVTDGDSSWQGRLVYTPSYNGPIIQGQWQCWNPLAGRWWATGGPLAAVAKADSPQPLSTLLASFPNLGVNATYSVIALKAGDGWNYFQGEASPIVIGIEGERIAIDFAPAPTIASPDQEVLLPALMNDVAVSDGNPESKEEKKRAKEAKKEEQQQDDQQDSQQADPQVNQEGQAIDLSTDWANSHWAGFDWQNFDWDKVDWEHLNWGAFGWGDSKYAEAIRAFVVDVQQCKANGWQSLGFNKAGECVAYYVKAHAPADFDWSKSGWGRSWNNRDDHNGYNRYGRHGDD